MECKYCLRNIQNRGSLIAHQQSCPLNPERVKHHRSDKAGAPLGNIPWNRGKSCPTNAWKKLYPNDQVFIENSTYARHSLKKRILEEDLLPYLCFQCGIGPRWRDKPMPLILDHKNGINNDNRIENLRFVCSNCDTQLPTYKAKNKRRKIG